MSEQNVQLHREFTEAFNSRDIEALIALCDPGIELRSGVGAIEGDYHGYEGVRRWHRDFQDAWGAEVRIDEEAYFDLGERVLAFYVLHGRGQGSQAQVAMPGAAVGTWRDGRIVHLQGYAHRADALSDLGVTEDELEPIAP